MARTKGAGPIPSLARAKWLGRPATAAVFAALQAEGEEARIVGGAVRNAVMRLPVKDIDMATTALPEEVLRLAKAAGLHAVPTGIEHGTVHDPLGGYPDLAARRVRFIGNARERIREDYLRILRFFRFFATYDRASLPDAEGLAAASAEKGGLAQLSGERIRAELLLLLAAPRAVEAARIMQ
ncbi:MAG: CCA tRNA nucleotidyltransferase, partial [Hyphomicrobium sp.]